MSAMWMVRAGSGAGLIGEFLDKSVVAIGWEKIGDLSSFISREEVLDQVQRLWPEYKLRKAGMTASHLFKLSHQIAEGDFVISYDPSSRCYHLGKICGEYRFDPTAIPNSPHIRSVRWITSIERDRISVPTKNSIGSISTLFRVPDQAADELLRLAEGQPVATFEREDEVEELKDEKDLLDDIQARSREFIKDRIVKLDWDDVQELVAGLLRAMGYKTQVSGKGSDRGKDIVASPDGFGFEQPRIVVEVKHRQGSIGAPDIRSFLGGRHKDDKGLYVSTGGFSKDALYEADRASIPLTLMDIDSLVDGIVDHYHQMDAETRTLLPLMKIYWPV